VPLIVTAVEAGKILIMRCRVAALPVVNRPPVRTFRRNLTNGSSSKQSPTRQSEAADKAKLICKKRLLIRINMNGIYIGKKVDLTAYSGYQRIT
jgi:auxin-responsive protein IAA